MAHKWITNLPTLLTACVADNDVIIVKMEKIYRKKTPDGIKYSSVEQICSAQMKNYGDHITWHINDTLDDALLIDASTNDVHLGYSALNFDLDDDIPDDFDYMYVIVGCRIIRHDEHKPEYNIRCSDADATENTGVICINGYTEARAVIAALKQQNINAEFEKTDT